MVDKVNGIQAAQKTSSSGRVPVPLNNSDIVVPVGQSYDKGIPQTKAFQQYDEKKFGSFENYAKQRAQYYYNNDLKNGKLEFVEPTKVLGFEVFKGYYQYQSSPGEKLGEIKSRYNLPDGAIGNQSTGGGGNIDKLEAAPVVKIPVEAMKKGVEKE